jgi:hypothetical protein
LNTSSHGFLYVANADYAAQNDQSFQLLNGVLSSVKSTVEFPPAIKQTIPFYVRHQDNYNVVNLSIVTAGGDCRHALKRSFQDFFKASGIHDGPFVWGKEYFPDNDGNDEEAAK